METALGSEPLVGKDETGGKRESEKPPYPPGWVDRVTDWVGQLPIPAWSFYLVLALAVTLLHSAVKWSDGSGTLSSFQVMTDISPFCIMTLLYYSDHWAVPAMVTFRPAMAVEESEYTRLLYELTTLPRLQTLIIGLMGVLYASAYYLFASGPEIKQFSLFTSPLGIVLDVGVGIIGYLAYSMLIYHIIRQTRVVSRIYKTCSHAKPPPQTPPQLLYRESFPIVAPRPLSPCELSQQAW